MQVVVDDARVRRDVRVLGGGGDDALEGPQHVLRLPRRERIAEPEGMRRGPPVRSPRHAEDRPAHGLRGCGGIGE